MGLSGCLRRPGRAVTALLCASFVAPRLAGGDETSLEGVVRAIRVVRLDVFEADRLGALGFVGTIGNALHVRTRERVVRDLLIIERGERVTRERAAEAARTLRQSGLFRTAFVGLVEAGDSVDVVVTTRDAWSTQLVAAFGTAGGSSELTLGLIESNVLGSGDVVSGIYRFSDQGDRASVRFVKRRLFGPHSRAGLAYAEGEDGVFREAFISRPFYSRYTPWTLGVLGSASRSKVWLYDRGEKSGRYRVRQDLAYAHGSIYRGERARWQLGLGVRLDDRRSAPIEGDAFSLGALRNDRRRLVTARVGYLDRRLISLTGVDRTGVPEDHALGWRLWLSAGMELEALGSTRDRPYAEASITGSVSLATGVFASADLRASGRLKGGGLDQREIASAVRLIGARWRRRTQALRVLARWGVGHSPEELLHVGARAGLRGFPFRIDRGTRALMANVEERIETGLEVFGLSLGLVAFADAAAAWEASEPVLIGDVRTDVGLGLRAGAPFTSLPFRVDVARGLGPGGGLEVSVATGQLFSLVRRLDFQAPLPTPFGPGLQ